LDVPPIHIRPNGAREMRVQIKEPNGFKRYGEAAARPSSKKRLQQRGPDCIPALGYDPPSSSKSD
jgi:hypothetical protein